MAESRDLRRFGLMEVPHDATCQARRHARAQETLREAGRRCRGALRPAPRFEAGDHLQTGGAWKDLPDQGVTLNRTQFPQRLHAKDLHEGGGPPPADSRDHGAKIGGDPLYLVREECGADPANPKLSSVPLVHLPVSIELDMHPIRELTHLQAHTPHDAPRAGLHADDRQRLGHGREGEGFHDHTGDARCTPPARGHRTRRHHEFRRPARDLDRSGFGMGARSSAALTLSRRALKVIVAICPSSSRFRASTSRMRASMASKRST